MFFSQNNLSESSYFDHFLYKKIPYTEEFYAMQS